jgi:hypothetical protein
LDLGVPEATTEGNVAPEVAAAVAALPPVTHKMTKKEIFAISLRYFGIAFKEIGVKATLVTGLEGLLA